MGGCASVDSCSAQYLTPVPPSWSSATATPPIPRFFGDGKGEQEGDDEAGAIQRNKQAAPPLPLPQRMPVSLLVRLCQLAHVTKHILWPSDHRLCLTPLSRGRGTKQRLPGMSTTTMRRAGELGERAAAVERGNTQARKPICEPCTSKISQAVC
jgi:hypothetical protein